MNAFAGRDVVRVRALLGVVVAMILPTLGCTERVVSSAVATPDHPTSTAYSVSLAAGTVDGLPACTAEIVGTTAYVASPPSLWVCKDNRKWKEIKCDNGSAGSVAYASATQTLWACIGHQWKPVTLPAGPAGAMGTPGAMGAPGSLVAAQPEPAGDHCAAGGQRIDIGADTDADGTLASSEIMQTVYVCNGAAAAPADGGTAAPDGGAGGAMDGGEQPLAVSCLNPIDNAILSVKAGTAILVQGRLAGGIAPITARVNGTAADITADGTTIAGLIPVRHGLNNVEFEATDSAGNVRRALCPFLAAGDFVGDSALFANSLSLRLRQSAIDDGARTGGIDSLADLVATMINSAGVRTLLDTSLMASNPLQPETCYQELFGVCVISFGVKYLSSALPGPDTVEMSLVSGGIAIRVRFERPSVRVALSGTVDSTGNLTAEFVEVDATFDVGVSGGRPHVSPRTVGAQVGQLSSDFTGVGAVLDFLLPFMNGTFRGLLASAVETIVVQETTNVLDSVVSSLDVSTLAASYTVPRVDSSGDVTMGFSTGVSGASVTPSRLLIGLATRFSAPAAPARPTLGIPIPEGLVPNDSSAAPPVAVAAHIGVLGQALHAYWRAGGLDGSLAIDGMTVTFTTPLPPAVMVRDAGSVALDLGIDATVSLPNFAAPITGRATARVVADVALLGGYLTFTGIHASESHVAITGGMPGASVSARLADAAVTLLEQMASIALREVMPRLPVPTFTIPNSLGAYGLPGGGELGSVGEMMSLSARHMEVLGAFGVR
jgi:hypothetical protein